MLLLPCLYVPVCYPVVRLSGCLKLCDVLDSLVLVVRNNPVTVTISGRNLTRTQKQRQPRLCLQP
jgi:hypothetical protein